MKVLILIHGMFPGYRAPIFKEIAKNLCEDVELEILAIGDGLTPTNEKFNFKIHTIKKKPLFILYGEVIKLTRKFDIIHYFPGSGFEFLPLFNLKSKFIFHFISVSVTGNYFYDLLVNTVKKIQPVFADMAIYTDKELKNHLKPYINIKTKILPVGYASDLFYECKRNTIKKEKLLIYHGSCHRNRKIERMIRVLSHLDKNFKLIIIGKFSNSYKEEIIELSKSLKCLSRLDFKEMQQDQIRDIIKKAYLCFSYVPSFECYQDQFVLKNIEYLACLRPVITTKTRYSLKFQNEIGKTNILLTEDNIVKMASDIKNSKKFVNNFYKNDFNRLIKIIKKYSNKSFIKDRLISYYFKILN